MTLVSGSEIKLVNRTEGSVHDTNGGVNVQASLVVLARNGWLELERSAGEIRIRLGRRAKELRSPEQRRTGWARGQAPVAPSIELTTVTCPGCGHGARLPAATTQRAMTSALWSIPPPR